MRKRPKATFRFAPSWRRRRRNRIPSLGVSRYPRGIGSVSTCWRPDLFDADTILRASVLRSDRRVQGWPSRSACHTGRSVLVGRPWASHWDAKAHSGRSSRCWVKSKLEGQEPKPLLSDEGFLESGFTVAAPVNYSLAWGEAGAISFGTGWYVRSKRSGRKAWLTIL